jgi:GTPase SAR1 family protein
MKIAIVGAPGTGKTWLATALNSFIFSANESAIEALQNVNIGDAPTLNTIGEFDLILLMGLDLQPVSSAHFNAEICEKEDSKIRAHLQNHGLVFKVIYGNPATRLATTLRLIQTKYTINFVAARACPEPVLATISSKIGQKWSWNCDKCSDPECEHRLFASLLTN